MKVFDSRQVTISDFRPGLWLGWTTKAARLGWAGLGRQPDRLGWACQAAGLGQPGGRRAGLGARGGQTGLGWAGRAE